MRYYVLTKVGMLFMKNSLKTSFESDDAEKLDGRKKEAGPAEHGGGHLPSQIITDQLTLFQPGGRLYPLPYYLPLLDFKTFHRL